MVDSPTTRNRLRKQEVGTNNNTWGTKLNEVLDCVDQVVDGVEAVDLGGATSYTLTTSDYTTSDQAKNRVLVCSNLHASGSDLIVPNVEHVYGVRNSGSTTLEVKTSAGTGVEIPAGRFTWVYCDGTNVISAAPTSLPVAFVPSLSNDPATVDYVDTAVAAASGLTAPFILVSGGDTTQGYLGQKLTVGFSSATTTQLSGLLSAQVEIDNAGGNEKSRILMAPGYVAGYLDGGRKDTVFTAFPGYAYNVVSGCTFVLTSAPTHAAKMRIALFNPNANYGINPNGNKINNSTATLNGIPGGQTLEITYDATLGDWE